MVIASVMSGQPTSRQAHVRRLDFWLIQFCLRVGTGVVSLERVEASLLRDVLLG